MAEEKYVCNKCGKAFESKPGAEKKACPVCGSLDSRKATQTASDCGRGTRFS